MPPSSIFESYSSAAAPTASPDLSALLCRWASTVTLDPLHAFSNALAMASLMKSAIVRKSDESSSSSCSGCCFCEPPLVR